MIDLFFLTTNRVKFDHLKYLLKAYPINLRTAVDYGKPYIEPQIHDRHMLLNESMLDANKRLLKAHLSTSKNLDLLNNNSNPEAETKEDLANLFQDRFFIIEDTSVIVDALSTIDNEVPGVDVKYWMKDLTFNDLDAQLKRAGNNRKVTVRSDVVLYLPKRFRSSKEQTFYKVFTGITEGVITSIDTEFQTNPMYPWLDNRTFNKWFVPDGESIPISLLPIQVATKFDFRRKAVEKLISHLQSLKLNLDTESIPSETPSQIPMFDPHSFILCGPSCAGKTVLAEHLVGDYGYLHIEASDFMHLAFHAKHGFNSAISIHNFAQEALKEDPEIVSRQIIKHIRDIGTAQIIITGFRSPKELSPFFNTKMGFKYCYVNASAEIRYQRSNLRARRDSSPSREDFLKRDKLQHSMGLDEIEANDHFDIIINESTLLNYLNGFVEKYIPGATLISNPKPFRELESCKRTPTLEESILLSLYTDSEDLISFLTTTEIAQKINTLLLKFRTSKSGENIVTNKNNVSRYFNQKLYPYYEVHQDGNIRKYRLSPTGKSLAVKIYRLLFLN